MVLGSLPAVGRRAIAVIGVLAVVAATSVSGVKAQQAPAAPADPFKFDTPSLLLFLTVQPAGIEAFETTMKGVKDALAKSEKAERKNQAAHWQVFKSPQAGGVVIYFWQLDNVSKDVSYNPFLILGEGGMKPEDVKVLFDKVNPNIAINLMAVSHLIDMKGGGL
jgi:hypothetical protein